MDEQSESRKWASNLARALRQWCDENGFTPRVKLADQLRIERSIWARIITGRSIAEDSDIYARIYLFTNLPHSDPTKIPPLVRNTLGVYSEEKRAWDEKRFSAWLRKHSTDGSSHTTQDNANFVARQESRLAVQPIDILNLSLGQLIDMIAVRISQQQGSVVQHETTTVHELIVKLLEALQPVISGSSEDRDVFEKENRPELGQLAILLDILTQQPPSKREFALSNL